MTKLNCFCIILFAAYISSDSLYFSEGVCILPDFLNTRVLLVELSFILNFEREMSPMDISFSPELCFKKSDCVAVMINGSWCWAAVSGDNRSSEDDDEWKNSFTVSGEQLCLCLLLQCRNKHLMFLELISLSFKRSS